MEGQIQLDNLVANTALLRGKGKNPDMARRPIIIYKERKTIIKRA